jgi:hypothetical protein
MGQRKVMSTSNEKAMRLALEALEDQNSLSKMKTARDILRKALAEQEPDDLMIAYMSGLHDGKKLIDRGNKPCQTCEALARTVMLDQSSHEQRTAAEGEDTRRAWVELTDEEVFEIFGRFTTMTGKSWLDLYRMTEAKRKEKNTRNGGCL